MRSSPRKILSALILTLSAAVAGGQTYTVLYSFAGGADGAGPAAPVTLDLTTGNLYGTTSSGGSGCQYPGCGTVFELTSAGVESVLYSFAGPPNDGVEPSDVFRDAGGNLFGTTLLGGPYEGEGGSGIVFRIDPDGAETVLHSFKGGADGTEPASGLIWDPNSGDFYGVTAGGGEYGDYGTVYATTATGSKTALYSFGASGTSGNTPEGKLVQDGAGNLYGMLSLGGLGCGVVFELTPPGVESPLYEFTGVRGDGCEPGPYDPGLLMDAQGNLFGTTWFGGTANNGVVFELNAGGVERVIYRFKGPKKGDGAWPLAGLVIDGAGNLYGTTEIGGTGQCNNGGHIPKGCGTVFELSPPATKHGRWRETIVRSFSGGADGSYPLAGLVLDSQTGGMYGTASAGGAYDKGVVFEILP